MRTSQIQQAIILAAGLGSRMKKHCHTKPKAMLEVGDHTLIYYQIIRLVNSGISKIYINCSYQAETLIEYINTIRIPGVIIRPIHEGDTPLDTGGGINNLLAYMKNEPFIVCNTDAWINFDLSLLSLNTDHLFHLLLTPSISNKGDFYISPMQQITNSPPGIAMTFTGISVMSPKIFDQNSRMNFSVVPFIRKGIENNLVEFQVTEDYWLDVGTPERYNQLLDDLKNQTITLPSL